MRGDRLGLLCTIVLCVSFLGCEEKATHEIDYGTLQGSVYRNRYFGMALTIPSDWSIQERQSTQAIVDTGEKLIAGEDKNLQAVMKASKEQSVNLLAAFKHPIGSPVMFNPSIMCIAERVRHMPGIQRGSDYLFHTRKVLEAGSMRVAFPKEVYSEAVGGVEFDVLYAETSVAGVSVKQKLYAAVMKGYALNLILSFETEEEESALEKILASATFERK